VNRAEAAAVDWSRVGPEWPHRSRSRFVSCAGQRWHVQQWPAPQPAAPELLLLHGTGASTHSWRALAPLLARHAGVLALDLPGHGFSAAAQHDGATLPGMARDVASLLRQLRVQPALIVGHSAGAAVAVQMALDAAAAAAPVPSAIVSLNGALLPLHGPTSLMFSPLAKLLAGNRLVPQLFAWSAASETRIRRLVASTGSMLDDEGVALYGHLVRDPAHVAGALTMMAHWDLQALAARLPQLQPPLWLVIGERDRMLPPSHARRVIARLPQARLCSLPGLGHLAHEEDPQAVLKLLQPLLHEAGVPAGG
jgi:magnesium chelatase accessory protein